MSVLFDKVLNSLHERARYFVAKREHEAILNTLKIGHANQFDTELLQTLASIRAILPECPNVLIDVGAHRGKFSAAADALFRLDSIYAFEPDVDLHDELRRSVDPDKLHLYDVVVSDDCGVTEFFLHADKSMNSTVAADAEALGRLFPLDPHAEIQPTTIATSTLDESLRSVGLAPDQRVMLKIDTQGNELSVLRGAESTMENVSSCLVEHIFCTPYQRTYRFEDLVAQMASFGFACESAVSLSRRATHEITAVDFLFVRRPGDGTAERSSRDRH